jgi:hypothetical protein
MQQQRCALLTFVIGILLVTASCGDKMVVPTSGAAGKVIDAKGQVNAKRGNGPLRPLKTGDPVFVKDTVITSANSSVTIELTHNRAIWTLDANEKSPMERSLAWTLARQKSSVFANNVKIGNSAAASDHGNTAGDTADTLQQPTAVTQSEVDPGPGIEAEDSDTPAVVAAASVDNETPLPRDRTPRIGGIGTAGAGKGGGGRGTSTRGGGSAKPDKTKPKDIKPFDFNPAGGETGNGTPTNTPGGTPGGEGGGGESPKPPPSPPPEPDKKPVPRFAVTGKTPLSEASTKAMVQKFATECHKGSSITGELNYKVVAKEGKITAFTWRRAGSLLPIAKCMKKKVLPFQLSGSGTVTGQIEF